MAQASSPQNAPPQPSGWVEVATQRQPIRGSQPAPAQAAQHATPRTHPRPGAGWRECVRRPRGDSTDQCAVRIRNGLDNIRHQHPSQLQAGGQHPWFTCGSLIRWCNRMSDLPWLSPRPEDQQRRDDHAEGETDPHSTPSTHQSSRIRGTSQTRRAAYLPHLLPQPIERITRVAVHLDVLATRRPPLLQPIATLSRPVSRVEHAKPRRWLDWRLQWPPLHFEPMR